MVLGPVTPVISKIRDRYLRELYLKIGRAKDINKIKRAVKKSCREVNARKEFKTSIIVIDVDPT